MKIHNIPFKQTGYFSNLICDYLDKKEGLTSFYEGYPSINGFRKQLELKQNFSVKNRTVLVDSLQNQYKSISVSKGTSENIKLLKQDTTFTITTGHQLNIFTGPLYFLYKIVSVINLTKQLKTEFPSKNFVPVYWMATEDHDFEEINYFNFKGQKVLWNRESSGGVGRLDLEGFDSVFEAFSNKLGNSTNANYIKQLFKNAYLKHSNLTEATRFLVNELFGKYGLVIVDGDDTNLKELFVPVVKEELLKTTSFIKVSETNEKLSDSYKIQVNPREINLFYLKNNLRERIVKDGELYKVNNTTITFSEEEILNEVENYPKRFSPNVILRPVYQEVILPNLAYIGGGGELAYWFQLKSNFSSLEIPFPILMLRNSVLLITEKQKKKLDKLNISIDEIFYKQEVLINKKVKEISEVNIDFTNQKLFLQEQFKALKKVALKTDKSFEGAVNAQEKKQLNGLQKLEKRLLKAQKRKLTNEVERVKAIQNELFPNQSLEERSRNFSEYYLELGDNLIPMLLEALDPLKQQFTIVEY